MSIHSLAASPSKVTPATEAPSRVLHSALEPMVPFAKVLEVARTESPGPDRISRSPKPEYTHGRLTVGLDSRGQPASVTYHAEDGSRLNTSAFDASQILQNAHSHGIDLQDLRGLGQQLDADGVGYRPYELYRGTGSDHGIEFEDLIKGGLGTAYDWRKDTMLHHKGPQAISSLVMARQVAADLGTAKHQEVTSECGIDPARFTPLASAHEAPRHMVAFNGAVASWHHTAEQASTVTSVTGGRVLELSPTLRPLATADLWLDPIRTPGG